MVEPDPASSELDAFLGSAPRARWRRWLLWAAILAGGALLVLLAGRFATGGQAGNYVSRAVVMGDLPVSQIVTAPLQPSATSAAGTAAAGTVREVMVAVGDTVTKGQLLARLDPQPFRESLVAGQRGLAESQAALARAQVSRRENDARLQLFEQVRRRSRGLAPSDREMAQAKAALSAVTDAVTAADAAVAAARADVAVRIEALAATEIRSPIAGVVIQGSATAGQQLGPSGAGALLFIIAAPYASLDLEAGIDPGAAERLALGAPARVTVADAPNRVFAGRLIRISQQQGGRRIRVRVTNPGALRPGMIATVSMATGLHRDVVIVPAAALQFARASDAQWGVGGGAAVYVLDSDGGPRRVPVRVIAGNGSGTEVAPGTLSPGMRVILGLR